MALPKITTSQQRKIEIIIRKWRTKLTWQLLVNTIEVELDLKTTRQTLTTYIGIATEFKQKKNELRSVSTEHNPDLAISEIKLLEKIRNQEANIKILEKKNNEQLRLIERIFMNARSIPNLDLKTLVAQRHEEK